MARPTDALQKPLSPFWKALGESKQGNIRQRYAQLHRGRVREEGGLHPLPTPRPPGTQPHQGVNRLTQGPQTPVCGTPLASQGLFPHVYDENNGTTFLKWLLYKTEDKALVPDAAQDFTIGTGTLVSIVGPFDGMNRFSPNAVIIWFILYLVAQLQKLFW